MVNAKKLKKIYANVKQVPIYLKQNFSIMVQKACKNLKFLSENGFFQSIFGWEISFEWPHQLRHAIRRWL